MFSWKWASGCVSGAPWPAFEVKDIAYSRKGIESLPDNWKIEVSTGCQAAACHPTQMDTPLEALCHIKLSVEGDKCPEAGCSIARECGNMKDCATGLPYVLSSP